MPPPRKEGSKPFVTQNCRTISLTRDQPPSHNAKMTGKPEASQNNNLKRKSSRPSRASSKQSDSPGPLDSRKEGGNVKTKELSSKPPIPLSITPWNGRSIQSEAKINYLRCLPGDLVTIQEIWQHSESRPDPGNGRKVAQTWWWYGFNT